MKKSIRYIILSILLLFLALTNVNAEQKSIIIEGSEDDYANSTAIAKNGDFVVVGEFSSKDIDGLTLNGSYDAFIVKYNEYGEQQWIKSFGGTEDDAFYDVISTSDNGYIAVGYVCSEDVKDMTLIGNCDAIAVKYDTDGNIEWQKNYGTTLDDKFNVISEASDGTFMLAGWDGYVVKIDEKGTIKLETRIDVVDVTYFQEKNEGGYYVGEFSGDSHLRSFDENFNLEWEQMPSFPSYQRDINDAILLEDDSIVIVGTYRNGGRIAFIAKYDSEGNLLWSSSYGSVHETFTSIHIDEDGNFVVVGGKKVDKNSESISKALLLKYDKEGNLLSEEVYPSESASWYYGADYVSKGGYVYVGSNYINGESYKDDILIVYNMEDFIYDITTNIEGKGSIEVIDKAKSGESITFKVTPEEGYVLSEVKVTDASGNVLTFTDYTFTMPNADVTIEVIFEKEEIKEEKNPDTTDIAVIACLAIIVFGGIGTAYSIRKLSWLK